MALIPGQTEFDAADLTEMIAALDAQSLDAYALKFGGMIVPAAKLAEYKAEYRTKLVGMLNALAK